MKIAYFDCFAGAAGDMIVAAMLDTGLDQQFLMSQLNSLSLKDLQIEITQTKRAGISALSFTPIAESQHHHRNIIDIEQIINNSTIIPPAKTRAIEIFKILAQAESKIHAKKPTEITFHEVGAIDSIADIVSTCVCLEELKIDKIYCSTLTVGTGTINCDHGRLPAPAPATLEILKTAKAPFSVKNTGFELLTPTAAAILTNITDEFTPQPEMTIDSIGYGAGSKNPDQFPNVLRLIIGQTTAGKGDTDSVALLETNIDDASGEVIGYVVEKLLNQGALDVWTQPIQMKKNRSAVVISMICEIDEINKMQNIIFEEGITLGIRKQVIDRAKLTRKFEKVNTKFGTIQIKTGFHNGILITAKPEYSECAKAAKNYNVAIKTVLQVAMNAFDSMRSD